MTKMNLNYQTFDPNFNPSRVLDRGGYKGYGYVVVREYGGIVLYIHEDISLYYGTFSAFPGSSYSFDDSTGNKRSLEMKTVDNQIVFVTKYVENESPEKIISDMHMFVDAITKCEDDFANYCMTHDD